MIKIDILLTIGGRSGLEVALNRTADYLAAHNCQIRLIQIVKPSVDWATKNMNFICLNMNSQIQLEECSSLYAAYLNSDPPNVIIVTGAPEAIYIAKIALNKSHLSIPTLLWLQNDLSYYSISSTSNTKILDCADIFLATNDIMAKVYKSYQPDKPVYRVYNPINPDNIVFSFDRSYNKIAFIGRLSSEKNPHLIIKALSLATSDWKLTIIGEGNESDSLHSLCNELKLNSQVHFYGWTDRPWDIVKDSKALIVSSDDSFEGGPMTAVEALACGMPVISTSVGFMPELIQEGKNGYIYNFNSPQDLANILDHFAALPFSPALADKCRDSVKNFNPEIALWDFLCKIVASSRLIGLRQRHWEDMNARLVTAKASVIISDIDYDYNNLSNLFYSLEYQTIEQQYLEIIIIHHNSDKNVTVLINDYEQRHSSNVIIVNCSTDNSPILTREDTFNIGRQYASDDIQIYLDSSTGSLTPYSIEELYMEKLCCPT